MQRVGFIGLGRMGGPCVRNLLKKGYEVRIWARSPEKARHLVEAGAVLCGSPAAAAAEADIFLTCVTAGPDVEDILLGEDGVCRGARPGLICADMSTISVSAARNLAERVAVHGAFFLDAPVSGGVRAAESGTLAIWDLPAPARLPRPATSLSFPPRFWPWERRSVCARRRERTPQGCAKPCSTEVPPRALFWKTRENAC